MIEFKYAKLGPEVDEAGELEGYASKFGILDQGGDVVVKGAFSASLSARKPKMLWSHDPGEPIGLWEVAEEDDEGLKVSGKLDLNVARAREIRSLIKTGAVNGLSIGYRARDARKTSRGRELRRLDLFEVSLVTFPMQLEAGVYAAKQVDLPDDVQLKRFVERSLRDAGISATRAKSAAADVASKWFGRDVQTGNASETLSATELVRQAMRDLRR